MGVFPKFFCQEGNLKIPPQPLLALPRTTSAERRTEYGKNRWNIPFGSHSQ